MVNSEIRLIIFFSFEYGEAPYSQQNKVLELTVAQIMSSLLQTTRPFRYDLKQVSYNYPVEVTNRFKGLHLIDSLKNYGSRFVPL